MHDIQQYMEWTRSTAVYPAEQALQYTALGLAGEVGEVCNSLKKVYRDDQGCVTPERRANLAKELGDVFWYLARLSDELELYLPAVLGNNVSKLEDRLSRDVIKGSGAER